MTESIRYRAGKLSLPVIFTLLATIQVVPTALAKPPTHTFRAHEKIRVQVKISLLPNMESYQAISEKALSKLKFSEQVEQAVKLLDILRHGAVGKTLESSIAGAKWVAMAWDELRELIHRVDRSRKQIEKLKSQSTIVAKAANLYLTNSGQADFDQLVNLKAGKLFL